MTVEEESGLHPESEWPRAEGLALYQRLLRQVAQLKSSVAQTIQFGRPDGRASHFARFLVVGAATLLINSLLLAFWTEVFGIYYLVSAVLATEIATLCGFCLTEFWVFREQRSGTGRGGRMVKFFLMNNVVLLLRGPLMYGFTTGLGWHYIISNLLSVGILTLIRYALADSWIWQIARVAGAEPEQPAKPAQGAEPR